MCRGRSSRARPDARQSTRRRTRRRQPEPRSCAPTSATATATTTTRPGCGRRGPHVAVRGEGRREQLRRSAPERDRVPVHARAVERAPRLDVRGREERYGEQDARGHPPRARRDAATVESVRLEADRDDGEACEDPEVPDPFAGGEREQAQARSRPRRPEAVPGDPASFPTRRARWPPIGRGTRRARGAVGTLPTARGLRSVRFPGRAPRSARRPGSMQCSRLGSTGRSRPPPTASSMPYRRTATTASSTTVIPLRFAVHHRSPGARRRTVVRGQRPRRGESSAPCPREGPRRRAWPRAAGLQIANAVREDCDDQQRDRRLPSECHPEGGGADREHRGGHPPRRVVTDSVGVRSARPGTAVRRTTSRRRRRAERADAPRAKPSRSGRSAGPTRTRLREGDSLRSRRSSLRTRPTRVSSPAAPGTQPSSTCRGASSHQTAATPSTTPSCAEGRVPRYRRVVLRLQRQG